jgi:hypothetical protein
MMNERIRLLAEQAGATTMQRSDWIDYGTLDLDVEKFAELIVRECCSAADEWYQKHNELHWDPAQHIRNHFGVE